MNDIRELRQRELADKWWDKGKWGIVYAAPRTGKTFIAVNILERFPPLCKMLIAYPEVKIKASWEDTFEKKNYDYSNVQFTTFISLHKYKEEEYDFLIIDEIHLLSEAQIEVLRNMCERLSVPLLGLSGTLSQWTQRVLREDLRLNVVASYSMETAIQEGILPDYEINIVTVPLNNTIPQLWKEGRKMSTEKSRWNKLMYLLNNENPDKPNFFVRLKLIEILQKSLAKRDKTIQLIEQFKGERLLIFCGRIEIADSLGIPSYHSKSFEKEIFDDFKEGRIPHLAVIKIGGTGVTFVPLNKVVINYFDSNEENLTQRVNRCMSLEYDNPGKKAVIYIISTEEEKEKEWLRKALSFFSKEKIKYL